MSPHSLLAVQQLGAGYEGTPILRDVDLVIKRGEIVAVIGRNGVGKTTLMKCLIGLLRATSGTIEYQGINITRLPANRRARKGIGYIPQGRGLFPLLSVGENLKVGELIGGDRDAKHYDLIFELFPVLADKLRQQAGTMSGGQQQMLAIARALVGGPDLILLDEPSEGIQPSIVSEIANSMRELNRRVGLTIILVEQNIKLIRSMAERCYVMNKGTIVEEVGMEQLADPATVRRYLAV